MMSKVAGSFRYSMSVHYRFVLASLTVACVAHNPSTSPMVVSSGRLVPRGFWEHNIAQLEQGQMPVNGVVHDEIRFQTTTSDINITLAANRNRAIWHNAAEGFGSWALDTVAEQGDAEQLKVLKDRLQTLAVSYIDTYAISRGKSWVAVDSLPKSITSVALLVLRKTVTDTVGDKRNFGRQAKQAGVEGVVVPRTFETSAEAIEALSGPTKSSTSDLVFIKLTSGSGGKQVEPVAAAGLAAFLAARGGLKRGELIQEGVSELALHDGKKFTIRCYFIVHGGALYVSHHSGANVHGPKFDSSQALYDIHVDHHHPDAFLDDLNVVVGEVAGAKWMAAIITAAKLAGPMFERVVAESANDNLRYHVFGVDVLPKTTGDVMFVESNIFPYIANMPCNFRMVRSVLRLLFGVLKGDGAVDEEMTKVWAVDPSSSQRWGRGDQRSEL
jgi:hypothetical protein